MLVQFSDGITVKITQAQLRALLNKYIREPMRALMVIPLPKAPRVWPNWATLDDCVMVFGKIFRPDDPKLKELLERQAAINARQAAKVIRHDTICLPAYSQSTIDNARAAFAAKVAALDICPQETTRMNEILKKARNLGAGEVAGMVTSKAPPAPKTGRKTRIIEYPQLRVRKYA